MFPMRCPVCHCPLESGVCSLCDFLHRQGWCLPREKYFLEHIVWPDVQKLIPLDMRQEAMDVARAVTVTGDVLADETPGSNARERQPLEARVHEKQLRWRTLQKPLKALGSTLENNSMSVTAFLGWMAFVAAVRTVVDKAPLASFCDWLFFSPLRTLVQCATQRKSGPALQKALNDSVRESLLGMLLVYRGYLDLTADEVERVEVLAELAGLIANEVSLNPTKYHRLYGALARDADADPAHPSLRTVLQRNLPAQALLACQETDFEATAFLRHVRRMLASDGPTEPSKNIERHILPEEIVPEVLGPEDLLVREEVTRERSLERLRSEARLADAEAATLDLYLQGLRQADIASRRGVSAGDVSKHTARYKTKLRRAAGLE